MAFTFLGTRLLYDHVRNGVLLLNVDWYSGVVDRHWNCRCVDLQGCCNDE